MSVLFRPYFHNETAANRAANGFNDGDRSVQALKGIVGKCLTYARPD